MAVPDTTETGERWVPPNTVFWAAAAVALAHLVVVLVRPSPTPVELAGFELLVVAGLAALELLYGRRRTLRRLAALVCLFLAFVGGTWLLLAQIAVRWVAVALAVVGSLSAYGLHRYQLVALGLVEVADEQ